MNNRASFITFILFTGLIRDGLAAETIQKIAARDYAYCSAFYSLQAISSSTEERKKLRSEKAVKLGQYSTILSDSETFSTEHKKAIEKILRELKEDSVPENTANRVAEFCDNIQEKYSPIVFRRIIEINKLNERGSN
ncbi:MAG: hypothetical protein ACOY9D_07120 [Pseudomonadota bacterium]